MEITDEVCQAAQNVIDRYLPSPQRWTKGHYKAANRRVCGYQAITELDCSDFVRGMLILAVATVIREQYPNAARITCHCMNDDPSSSACTELTITSFNDHWSIRYADVRRVFEKVAAG